jgi:hypothetical protein
MGEVRGAHPARMAKKQPGQEGEESAQAIMQQPLELRSYITDFLKKKR